MSAEIIDNSAELSNQTASATPKRRKIANAFWEPIQQFKLLMWMLGSTAVVAVLLGIFLYLTFDELISAVIVDSESKSYYATMIETELVRLFTFCAALFVLYVILLAAVCVAYTHKMIGPIRSFNRHVDALLIGDYSSRVTLRKGDLNTLNEFGDKLNQLAVNIDITKHKQ